MSPVDPWKVSPETLELVVRPMLLFEHVADEAAEIEQHPFEGVVTFPAQCVRCLLYTSPSPRDS